MAKWAQGIAEKGHTVHKLDENGSHRASNNQEQQTEVELSDSELISICMTWVGLSGQLSLCAALGAAQGQ